MEKKISILFIGTQIATGGAQKLLLELGEWLSSQGYDVTTVFFYDRDNLYENWLSSYPFPIYNLNAFNNNLSRIKNISNLIVGLNKLWGIFRKKNFDATITFTHDSNILGLPIAWLAHVPVRIGTHLGEIRGMPSWQRKLHTFLINIGIIQTLVTSSSRIKKDSILQGVKSNSIQVIHNSIKPFEIKKTIRTEGRYYLQLSSTNIVVLSIGRLVYEKGHEFLIKAMSKVKESNDNVKTYICGSGPLYEYLDGLIKDLNLQEHVKLLGYTENLTQLLASADVFVLPSRWEGLPMALLEAMMAGLPIIATQVSGVEEVIENKKHGLLIPTGDVDALAEAILQLTKSQEQRRKMGLISRKHILDNYSISVMANKYIDLILSSKEKIRK